MLLNKQELEMFLVVTLTVVEQPLLVTSIRRTSSPRLCLAALSPCPEIFSGALAEAFFETLVQLLCDSSENLPCMCQRLSLPAYFSVLVILLWFLTETKLVLLWMYSLSVYRCFYRYVHLYEFVHIFSMLLMEYLLTHGVVLRPRFSG